MKHISLASFIAGLFLLSSCQNKTSDNVVSQQYIHKYGYTVSQAEWEERNYPGQIVSYLQDGTVLTETYENNILHGPTTRTYPNSQTVQEFRLYNQGSVVKTITYNPKGMPIEEIAILSPTRKKITKWYQDGVPMLIEEYSGDELIEGKYFTPQHETESSIAKGQGARIERTVEGTLLAKAVFEDGYSVKKETFYPTGTPESIAFYYKNKLSGEKKTFSPSGEPLSTEEFLDDKLHGRATYYANGNRFLEASYRFGAKHGIERHFIDGMTLGQEVAYENGLQHGPTTFFLEHDTKVQWFYEGREVSKRKFKELSELDELLSHTAPNHQTPRH